MINVNFGNDIHRQKDESLHPLYISGSLNKLHSAVFLFALKLQLYCMSNALFRTHDYVFYNTDKYLFPSIHSIVTVCFVPVFGIFM